MKRERNLRVATFLMVIHGRKNRRTKRLTAMLTIQGSSTRTRTGIHLDGCKFLSLLSFLWESVQMLLACPCNWLFTHLWCRNAVAKASHYVTTTMWRLNSQSFFLSRVAAGLYVVWQARKEKGTGTQFLFFFSLSHYARQEQRKRK